MITTRSLGELPHPARLREVCQAIALLDEIIEPQFDMRYFSYDVDWDAREELASMRDGEGSFFFVWFSPHGVVIRGYDKESAAAKEPPSQSDLFEGLPTALDAVRTEPAFLVDQLTFAIWRATEDDRYRVGKLPKAPKAQDFDGSGRLLACLESHPANFIAYAKAYHEVAVKMRDVERFFDRSTIREEDVLHIHPAADVAAALESARQLGFKTSTSEGKPLKPLGAASAVVVAPPEPRDVKGSAEFSIVKDGRRTKLVYAGKVQAWVDDADVYDRVFEFAATQGLKKKT